jgi:preprotein translocase subunit SecG
MNFQTMNKQRKFVLIAAAVGIVSLFLPWLKVSFFGASGSVNAMKSNTGYFLFAMFGVCGVMAYLGNQLTNIDKKNWVITLICGILATGWILLTWVGATNSEYAAISTLAWGFYLSLLSAIGVVVAAFMFRSPSDNIKDGFNSLKNDISNRIGNNSGNTNTGGTANTNTGVGNNPGNTNPPH